MNGILSVSFILGSFSNAKSRLTTFLFDILAPFGFPVEPDVYKRYNTFSGFTSLGSFVEGYCSNDAIASSINKVLEHLGKIKESALLVSKNFAFESSSIYSIRLAGYS